MLIKKLAALSAALVICLCSVISSPVRDTAVSADRTVTFESFGVNVNGGEPIRGVDISSITAIEKAGVVFYDSYGNKEDGMRRPETGEASAGRQSL